MMLLAKRDGVRRKSGAAEEVAALDTQIHEHSFREHLPRRWNVDFLFSRCGYETYGDPVLAVWATILIEICTLEHHWENAVLGCASESPYRSGERGDTAWLEDARHTWSRDLGASVLVDALRALRVVVLPPDPNEDDAYHEEADVADVGHGAAPWRSGTLASGGNRIIDGRR